MRSTFSLPKFLKMNYTLKPLLQNQVVLYFLVLLSIIQLSMFVNNSDMLSLVIFILIGFLTTFFSKNMIVVMVIALCITSLLRVGIKNSTPENFEGEQTKDHIPSTDDKNSNETTDETKDEMSEEMLAIKKELPEFEETYKNLMSNMDEQKQFLKNLQQMEPMLAKAEAFVTKFDKYNKKKA